MARERRRRRRGPAESDAQEVPKAPAYIKRKIPHYSILSDDELSVIAVSYTHLTLPTKRIV